MACVLVVDDDPAVLLTERMILLGAGHAVSTARDGVECEEMLSRVQPDVIVMDLFMPRQTGFETIARAKLRNPDLKILIVSGGGHTGGVDPLTFAKQRGADAVLWKPFEPEALVEAVDALASASSARTNAEVGCCDGAKPPR